MQSTTITKNSSRVTWYNAFTVDHTHYNDIFHSLMMHLKDKKYFDVKDIKEWLNK